MSSAGVCFPQQALPADAKHGRPSAAMLAARGAGFRPNLIAISAVRRNIFGAADHEECRSFVEMHLNQQHLDSMGYWGFDFVNEVPRPGKRSRFVWEAVSGVAAGAARPAKRACRAAEPDIAHLYPEPLEAVRLEQPRPVPVPPSAPPPPLDKKTKQPEITEFLKLKKDIPQRLAAKKINLTPSPSRTTRKTAAARTRKTRKSLKS